MDSAEEKRGKKRERARRYRASLSEEKKAEIRAKDAERARKKRKENPQHVYEIDRRSKEKNKDKVKARSKKYYDFSRGTILYKKKEYYSQNSERIKAEISASRWADIESHRKKMRERWANLSPEEKKKANDIKKKAVAKKPEHYLKKRREWYTRTYEERRGIGQKYSAIRRARIASSPKLEHVVREDVLKLWGSLCHICDLPIDLTINAAPRKGDLNWKSGLHLDHVIPLSRGGEHTLENIKPAHAICNIRKSNKTLEELYELPDEH